MKSRQCCGKREDRERTSTIAWLGIAMGLLFFVSATTRGDENPRAEEAFWRKLDTRVGIVWSAQPLRQNIVKLAASLEIAIWLDRRIDPTRELELTMSDTPLRSVLDTIASRVDAGVATVGSVVYIGPKGMASKISTLAALRSDEAARIAADTRSQIAGAAAWKWDELATPQELFATLGREAGLSIDGLQNIPHDLWPAADLPPLTVGERLTLLLAGFDLTFAWEEGGRRIRLLPVPESPTLVRSYPLGRPINFLSQLQAAAPQASVKRDGELVMVTGRAEDHESVRRWLAPNKSKPSAAGQAKTVYTLKVSAPLGDVLKTLQEKAGLRLNIDPAVKENLRQRVNFEVTDATMEELIQAVLKETGLRYELAGRDLKILPGKK